MLAGAEGFEPPTIGFGDRCSTNWNYAPAFNEANYTNCLSKVKPFFSDHDLNAQYIGETTIFAEKTF